MLRRCAARFSAAKVAPKATKAAEPQFSKVSGATGGDDTVVDKGIVVGCVGAFVLWQLFGPEVIAHH